MDLVTPKPLNKSNSNKKVTPITFYSESKNVLQISIRVGGIGLSCRSASLNHESLFLTHKLASQGSNTFFLCTKFPHVNMDKNLTAIKLRLALLTDTYLDRLYIVVCRYYLSIIFIAVKHLFEDTLYLSTKLLGLYRYHIYNVGLYLSINMGSLCRYIRKIFKDQSQFSFSLVDVTFPSFLCYTHILDLLSEHNLL